MKQRHTLWRHILLILGLTAPGLWGQLQVPPQHSRDITQGDHLVIYEQGDVLQLRLTTQMNMRAVIRKPRAQGWTHDVNAEADGTVVLDSCSQPRELRTVRFHKQVVGGGDALAEEGFYYRFRGTYTTCGDGGGGAGGEQQPNRFSYDLKLEGPLEINPRFNVAGVDRFVTLRASRKEMNAEGQLIPVAVDVKWSLGLNQEGPVFRTEEGEPLGNQAASVVRLYHNDTGDFDVLATLEGEGGGTDRAKVHFVRVKVTGPERTVEGLNSGNFFATIIGNIDLIDTDYNWTASWPGKGEEPPIVGHRPEVNFEHPDQEKTRILKASWFAHRYLIPDPNDGDLREARVTGYECVYQLRVTVTLDGHEVESEPFDWTVSVIMSGSVPLRNNIWKDPHTIQIDKKEDGLFYVVGQGQFRRVLLNEIVDTPPTSDFYKKVETHEFHHVAQFWEIEPWAGMWDVDQFYKDIISKLPGQPNKNALIEEIMDAITEWHQKELEEKFVPNRIEMEWQAYQAEHEIAPFYLEIHRIEDVPKRENQ